MPLELVHPCWDAHSGVRALVTTRYGGVSEGPYAELNLGARVGDHDKAVTENRSRLEEISGPIQWLDQRHRSEIFEATGKRPDLLPVADAVWTSVPGLAIGVLTADCFPLFLADRRGEVVGLAHCGWKPLAAEVVTKLVRAMPCRAGDLVAWIGPGISLRNYRVGEDFVRSLRASKVESLLEGVLRSTSGGVHADLEQLIRNQLCALGVRVCSQRPPCTFEDNRFYSHRRHGPSTGRFGSVIWLVSRHTSRVASE